MFRKMPFFLSLIFLFSFSSVVFSDPQKKNHSQPGWSWKRFFKSITFLSLSFSQANGQVRDSFSTVQPLDQSKKNPEIYIPGPYRTEKKGSFAQFKDYLSVMLAKAKGRGGRARLRGRRLNRYGQEIVYTNKAKPVGKLSWEDSVYMYHCTAVLVGPSQILTNGHCTVTEKEDANNQVAYRSLEEEWRKSLKFLPNFYDGISLDSSSWSYAVFSPEYSKIKKDGFAWDWAIIGLQKPLGYTYGWYQLERRTYDDYTKGEKVVQTAYSGDYCSSSPCTVECSIQGIINLGDYLNIGHDCDSEKGSSGSALVVDKELAGSSNETKKYVYPTIVALHHAEILNGDDANENKIYSTSTANLAIATAPAYDALAYVLKYIETNPVVYTDSSVQPPVPLFNESLSYNFEEECRLLYNTDYFYLENFVGIVSGFAGGSLFTTLMVYTIIKCTSEEKDCCSHKRIIQNDKKDAVVELKSAKNNSDYDLMGDDSDESMDV